VGCGDGHEAYSLFFLISADMREVDIRMIAADVNLTAVSNATGFETLSSAIPSWINPDKYFIKLSDSTYKIKKEITDKIYFEFHNAQNIGSYNKEFDLVVARDLSLFLSAEDYKTFLENISSKIVSGGVLVIGDNEKVSNIKNFTKIQDENITAYVKN
jgi:chemotaxis protein methyltransferase CheR